MVDPTNASGADPEQVAELLGMVLAEVRRSFGELPPLQIDGSAN